MGFSITLQPDNHTFTADWRTILELQISMPSSCRGVAAMAACGLCKADVCKVRGSRRQRTCPVREERMRASRYFVGAIPKSDLVINLTGVLWMGNAMD